MAVGALDVVQAFVEAARDADAPGYAAPKCRALVGWHAQTLADSGYDLQLLVTALEHRGSNVAYLGEWLSKAAKSREAARARAHVVLPRPDPLPATDPKVRRGTPTDEDGNRVYAADASGIVAAWVDACRDATQLQFADRRTLDIIGFHAKRLLAKGYKAETLLGALQGRQRTNPTYLAEWVRRAQLAEDDEAHVQRMSTDRDDATQAVMAVRAVPAIVRPSEPLSPVAPAVLEARLARLDRFFATMSDVGWRQKLEALAEAIPAANIETWFALTQYVVGNPPTLLFPNAFARDWVATHYGRELRTVLGEVPRCELIDATPQRIWGDPGPAAEGR